jgi:methylated-DNA-protein-cysteine methyltransferase-like protein
VGWALRTLPEDSRVPWHRVLNARGAISSRGIPLAEDIQRRLLQREGVRFNDSGRVDLERYRWNGRATRKKQPGTAGRRPRASSRRAD